MDENKSIGRQIQGALMTGVSYMLPFVVAGGIYIALGFLFGGYDIPSTAVQGGNFASTTFWIGKIGLDTFMVPIMAGFVAYGIADKPGIAPGMFGGWLALDPWGAASNGLNYGPSGFIGGIVAGLLAGYIVNLLKKIPLSGMLRSLLTTLIIPLVGVGAVCYLMFYVVGAPLAALNAALTNFLAGLGQGSKILLGIVQGCMLAFDMGGTVNKIAYAFAVGMLSGATDPASELCMPMGANFVACCTPPLGTALAVLIGNALGKKKFTAEERSTGSVAGCFVGAACMITEFAIPYAVADPFRVIPSLMVGSALGAVLTYIMNVGIIAPHGGVFVIFFACSNIIGYFIALLAGSAATAACLLALKKDVEDEEIEEDEDGWA